MLRDVVLYFGETYDTDGGSYTALSLEYVVVWLRGVSTAFGANTLWGAGLVIVVAVLVFAWYVRHQPVYAVALASPLMVQGAYAVLSGVAFSPRFFI